MYSSAAYAMSVPSSTAIRIWHTCDKAMNSLCRRMVVASASVLIASAIVTPVRAVGARSDAVPVATRMRNVNLHIGQGIELLIDDLSGRMLSRVSGKPPVFDDLDSYFLDIDAARVSMTGESLTSLMNNYVFAYPGAPLTHLKISIENGELTQSGTLRKGVGVPFTMHATVTATKDGKIRLHPTAMKAAGVIPKRLLDFFGLTLDRLITLKPGSPMTIEGDDLLLDPERLLPPPRIRGRLTSVTIDKGRLVEHFGDVDAGRHGVAPPDRSASNYMYFRGGTLRFGKLTMDDTDLLLIDADPKGPFDFSPQKYNDQLVAGYSKNTPTHGLIVYMPTLNNLARVGTSGGLTPAATGR